MEDTSAESRDEREGWTVALVVSEGGSEELNKAAWGEAYVVGVSSNSDT